MASKIIRTVFQFRRATTAEWLLNKDVIPAPGEPCYDLDRHTLKVGDGILTYEQLPTIGGVNVTVAADGKSVIVEDDVFKLIGFDAAEVGAQPRKNADGNLEWFIPSTKDVDDLKAIVEGVKTNVTTLQTTVETIREIVLPSEDGTAPLLDRVESLEHKMDGTGQGTVDAKIDAKINEFAARVTEDGTINTIQELITYVSEHGSEVAAITADIMDLKNLVGVDPVYEQIRAAIASSGHITKTEAEDILLSKVEASEILEHVAYEISSKPIGTLVDYREKEIRVMCPVDTEFTLQNSGENADANAYYIGFKAYAPAGAVSFKEDTAEIIADPTMYYFDNNEFAGVDKYGRKYSIIWLPVANCVDGAWTYYGAKSTVNKYIGWHYSVEWYDANGIKIAADTIRINLANEDCYTAIEPFYMANVVKGVSVNGTLMDIIGGKVDIKINDVVKSSDEIVVNEDGTLGVKTISFSKITQEEDEMIIMDGGGAA